MTVPPLRLLAFTVARYDRQSRPVTAADAATHFEVSRAVVTARFETLADCHLLAAVEEGYRPTVTARELLQLDPGEGALVVDPDPE